MSRASLLQLAAYGEQDIRICGNPQVSYFKSVYKRHTNFTMADIKQTFNGQPRLGTINSVKINHSGDLLSDMALQLQLKFKADAVDKQYSFVKNIGYNIIDYIELKFNGQTIDKHYSDWLNIYYELTTDENIKKAYSKLLNDDEKYNKIQYTTTDEVTLNLTIPLIFWFNKYNNLALPIIGLKHQSIYLNVKFREFEKLINKHADTAFNTDNISLDTNNTYIICNYVFLGNDERKYFANSKLEYLIENVQDIRNNTVMDISTNSSSLTTKEIDLDALKGPVKSLFWVNQLNKYRDGDKYFLGNDLDSASRNFILRFCTTGLRKLNSGSKVEWRVVSGGNIISQVFNKTNTVHGESSTFGSFELASADNHTSSKLNTLFKDYEPLVKFINGVSLTIGPVHDGLTIDLSALTTSDSNVGYYDCMSFANGLLPVSVASKYTSSVGVSGTDSHDFAHQNTTSNHVFSSSNITNEATTKVRLYGHNLYGNYIDNSGQQLNKSSLKLNGLSKFDFDSNYFNYYQPLKRNCSIPHAGINMYSFAIKPFDHQPSGTCNFSRLNTCRLSLTFNSSIENGIVNIYALGYNVLKIENGMGGLLFSN